jgi:hypothetical protein
MKGILPWIGPLVFLGLVLNFAGQYGRCWQFGRYGMPSSLLRADGKYLDGTEVDPLSLAIARSGWEEEGYLAWLFVLAVLFGALVVRMRRLQREQADLFARQLRIARGMPPAASTQGDSNE